MQKISNISSRTIQIYFTTLLILFHSILSVKDQNYCDWTVERIKSIESIKERAIGQGEFGQLFGNDQYVVKDFQGNQSANIQSANKEIQAVLAFDDLNIIQTVQNGCYIKIDTSITIGFETYYYPYSSQNALDNYAEKTQIQKDIWFADQIFKMLSTIKKMHDQKICHFDIKLENFRWMNQFTPVIVDLGFTQPYEIAMKKYNQLGSTFYQGLLVAQNKAKQILDQCSADVYAIAVLVYKFMVNNVNNYVRKSFFKTQLKKQTQNFVFQNYASQLQKMLQEGDDVLEKRGNISEALVAITKIIQQMVKSDDYKNEFENYLNQEEQYYNGNEEENPLNFVSQYWQEELKIQQVQRRKIYYKKYAETLEKALDEYCTIPKVNLDIFKQNYVSSKPNLKTEDNQFESIVTEQTIDYEQKELEEKNNSKIVKNEMKVLKNQIQQIEQKIQQENNISEQNQSKIKLLELKENEVTLQKKLNDHTLNAVQNSILHMKKLQKYNDWILI